MMKIAKIIAWIGLLSMSAVLAYGFTVGSFAEDGKALLGNPWGIVSLVDLYVGFSLFSIWIIYREKSLGRSVIWVILMMVLGFFTGAFYSLIALYSCDNDWRRFWLGKHSESSNG